MIRLARLLPLAVLLALAGPSASVRADGDGPPAGLFGGGGGSTVIVSGGTGGAVGAKSYEVGFYGAAPQPTRYWFTTSAPAPGVITDLYSSLDGADGANYIVTVSICHAGTCNAVAGLANQGVNNGEGGPTNASSDVAPLHTQPSGSNSFLAGDGIAIDFSTVGGTFLDCHENIRVTM